MDKDEQIRKTVREGYARVARQGSSCCGSAASAQSQSGCCGSGPSQAQLVGKAIGYSDEEMSLVPDGANLGLGCGNPLALASLKEGETVLDLGSGAGFDSFLAASMVGQSGHVIGVDMTPEMLEKARDNACKGGYKNVDFRLGEIENLPVPDNSVDIVISNCVINLSPDKPRVFREAYRVLKPGGRLIVSDMVLLKELPPEILKSAVAYVGCVSGAIKKDAYIEAIKEVGFRDVEIVDETRYPIESISLAMSALDSHDLNTVVRYADYVASVKVKGVK